MLSLLRRPGESEKIVLLDQQYRTFPSFPLKGIEQ